MSIGDFGDEEPPRKRGRPRKDPAPTVTKQQLLDMALANLGEPSGTPVTEDEMSFSGLFDETVMNSVVKVRVIRKDPNEGIVGYLEDPTMGEAEIAERWGGSSYLVQAIDAKGHVRKSAAIKIAGDPIFISKVEEMKWRRRRGLDVGEGAPVPGAPVPGTPALSLQEIMMLMQTQDERRRSEEREHQERLRKIEIDAQALQRRESAEYADRVRREQVEADARARRDDEERERRRAKDEEEREARRRREQAESEQRQQAFMQQTIQMLTQSSNQALQFVRAASEQKPEGNNTLMEAVKTVVAIKEAFGGEGGGDVEETPMNLLIKHGADWVNGLSNGIAGAIREVKGGGVSGQQAAAAAATPPARHLQAVPAPKSPIAMLPADHPLNAKVEALAGKLLAKGLDPVAAMTSIVDNVLRDVDRLPVPGKNGVPGEGKAFVQGPEGVAKVTALHESPPAPAPAAEATNGHAAEPRVYRLSVRR